MKKLRNLILTTTVFSMGLLFSSLANAAPAGKILFVYGKAQLQRDATIFTAKRGMAIEAGDIVKTAKASSAQVKLSDGTLVALRPNSEWNLQEYVYKQENPGLGKQSSDLLKGGLRAVTGLIGKADPKKIKYTAGTTTIGIRGTTFELANITSGTNSGVYVRVETGQVNVANRGGAVDVFPNQIIKVEGNKAPVEIDSTQVFAGIEQQIAKEGGAIASAPRQTTASEQEENNQMIVAATGSLLATENEPTTVETMAKETSAENTSIVAVTTDKLEEAMEYHKLALELKGLGLEIPEKSGAVHAGPAKMTLSKATENFMNSSGKFKGKGYKELSQAYAKLPAADKQELKSKGKDLHPLKHFDKAMSFNKTEVTIEDDGEIKFTKKDHPDVMAKIESNGKEAHIGIGSASFTLPNATYTYKLNAGTTTKSKIKVGDVEANNLSGFLKVDFANKKFVDANLVYKYNPDNSNATTTHTNQGVAAGSYIHDSGAFHLNFARLHTETVDITANTNIKKTYFYTNEQKVGELVGNFYTINSEDKAKGVYALSFLENNNRVNAIGYLEFEKDK